MKIRERLLTNAESVLSVVNACWSHFQKNFNCDSSEMFFYSFFSIYRIYFQDSDIDLPGVSEMILGGSFTRRS